MKKYRVKFERVVREEGFVCESYGLGPPWEGTEKEAEEIAKKQRKLNPKTKFKAEPVR